MDGASSNAPGNSRATIEDLVRHLRDVREAVDRQAGRNDVQQQAFDQLYEELRQYKEDFIFQAEKPLLLDLLLFYDSLNWFKESLVRKDVGQDVIADSFQYLLDEFLELLYRRDVLPMESQEAFDRATQKPVKVVYSDAPEMDYRVDHVLKRGFTRAGRLLRAEEVVLTRFRGSQESG